MNPKDRFRQLDGLRGLAAMVVMLYHYCWFYNSEFHSFYFETNIFEYGFYGVELFFMISGFVIYYTLQRNNVQDFLVNRFIRLFPTYWLCLVLTFTIVFFSPLNEYRTASPLDALINLTMLNGAFHVKYVDPSYWSLQIELFFYFTMALILFFDRLKNVTLLLWSWLALVFIYDQVQKLPGLGLLLNLQFGPLFVAGICFYRIKVSATRDWSDYFLLLASYGCSLLAIRYEQSFLAITVIYVVFALAIFTERSFLTSRLFTFLGAISYALYLVHQNIGFVILHEFQLRGYTSLYLVLVPVVAAISLSWIITFYFERPVMEAMRKYYERTFNKNSLPQKIRQPGDERD
jgi:peptidoglycan/LPS O-acetylase OafA/YrhL